MDRGTDCSNRRQRRIDPGAGRVRLEHGVGDELRIQTVEKAGYGRAISTMAEMNSQIKS